MYYSLPAWFLVGFFQSSLRNKRCKQEESKHISCNFKNGIPDANVSKLFIECFVSHFHSSRHHIMNLNFSIQHSVSSVTLSVCPSVGPSLCWSLPQLITYSRKTSFTSLYSMNFTADFYMTETNGLKPNFVHVALFFLPWSFLTFPRSFSISFSFLLKKNSHRFGYLPLRDRLGSLLERSLVS